MLDAPESLEIHPADTEEEEPALHEPARAVYLRITLQVVAVLPQLRLAELIILSQQVAVGKVEDLVLSEEKREAVQQGQRELLLLEEELPVGLRQAEEQEVRHGLLHLPEVPMAVLVLEERVVYGK